MNCSAIGIFLVNISTKLSTKIFLLQTFSIFSLINLSLQSTCWPFIHPSYPHLNFLLWIFINHSTTESVKGGIFEVSSLASQRKPQKFFRKSPTDKWRFPLIKNTATDTKKFTRIQFVALSFHQCSDRHSRSEIETFAECGFEFRLINESLDGEFLWKFNRRWKSFGIASMMIGAFHSWID